MKHILPILTAAAVLGLAACQSFNPPPESDPCPHEPEGAKQACTQRTSKLPDGVARAWGDPGSFWTEADLFDAATGDRLLVVAFIDGTGPQRRMFVEALEAWREAIGDLVPIKVTDKNPEKAHIRVAFVCQGHWSYVGRDARHAPKRMATMNISLQGTDGFDEWKEKVRHEFGHALGLRHEHAHPSSGIAWNKEAVYAFYAQLQGWSRATVDAQVFTPAPDQWVGTRHDPKSIMHYPVPPELTLDGNGVGWNENLSDLDIAFVRQIYERKPPVKVGEGALSQTWSRRIYLPPAYAEPPPELDLSTKGKGVQYGD